jgi:hypothetical protein
MGLRAPRSTPVDGDCPSLEARVSSADALVLVASNVSHPAAAKVRDVARRRGTPLTAAVGPGVARVRASIAAVLTGVPHSP